MDQLLSNIQQTFTKLQNTDTTKNINKSNLLQSQQISQQKINELLEQSANTLLCGPTCQKLKVTEELKQKYLDAETNMQTAPIQLEQSKKNYYVYSEGRPFYDNMKEEELKEKAEQISDLVGANFNDELTNANTMNTYLNTALINSKHTEELLKEYLNKNKTLKLQLRESHGDILTNDRKTYYETEALERLQTWYKFWWFVYYIIIIILLLALLFASGKLDGQIYKKILLIVLLVFYPYYIDFLVKWIYGIWISFTNRLPKNVYNNL